ncbi:hypothetical protein [Mycobacterium sp. 050134]|uniref:hypothetical protein n=1 Tax=Mycobacterium sp. 050134 TaxID=3096111 RepID=UPI002EDBA614
MTYLRGALVEFMPTPLIPIPNVIVFQYNPETMTHTWTQPDAPAAGPNQTTSNPLAVNGNPGESFSFTMSLDAADSIADGSVSAGLAEISGVYSRIAALEMLLYPADATTDGLLGTVTAAIGGALGIGGGGPPPRSIPAHVLNIVLFVWGPGRIVPVRVTALTIHEKLYDELLNPTKAEVQITLKVLTSDDLKHDTETLAGVARTAADYTNGLRQALAVANLVNAVESIVGMLPV